MILRGKPCIRGTRISVEMILEWIASGASRDEILMVSPHLSSDDIEAVLATPHNRSITTRLSPREITD